MSEKWSTRFVGMVFVIGAAFTIGCEVPYLTSENPQAPDLKTSAGVSIETADVFGQGLMGPVMAEDGATIRRTSTGISMRLSMPTPQPGSYTYPSGPPGGAWTDEEGPPEAFTLWAFIFNNPEECGTPFECGPGDLGGDAGGGAFFVAGHVVDGSVLNLSGRVSNNSEPFGGVPLENVGQAHVHLAVAPHGALDPTLLPEQIKTPTGPAVDIWWLALFVD